MPSRKKIGPGQWDVSIAEHLAPGETYQQAAVRGLKEELGIDCALKALQGPLTMTHARKLEVFGQFSDAEFVQCYRLAGFHGTVQTDPEEVVETRWANLKDIHQDATEYPGLYTQWLMDEMQRMDWLQAKYLKMSKDAPVMQPAAAEKWHDQCHEQHDPKGYNGL